MTNKRNGDAGAPARTVLVVEADGARAKKLRAELERRGFAVSVRRNGSAESAASGRESPSPSIEHAEGLTSPKGCVVVGTAAPNVYAHEFGHLCNLKDIYPRRPRKTDLTVTGAVARDRLERDWSSAVEEGYYPAGLQQGNLIERMLMCGIPTATGVRTDVSSGDVYGLWRHWRKAEDSDHWDWFHDLGTVPVGFHLHGEKQPIVEQ